jgi:hypothetical protein
VSFYADLHALADTIACDYCKAAAGQHCVTNTGRRSSWPHSARTRAIFEANSLGYCQGMRDGLREAADLAERAGLRQPVAAGALVGLAQGLRDRAEGWES